MPIYQRHNTETLLQALDRGETAPVYLLFGNRYLCRDFADELIRRLLPDEGARASALKAIDGEQEAIERTLGLLRSYSLFGGRQVFRVSDSRLFQAKATSGDPEASDKAGKPSKDEAADVFLAALEAGWPTGNILVLLADAADKRKKLFKHLEKYAVVVDLAVDEGGSSVARKGQEALLQEVVWKILASFSKKLEGRALPVLLERVGFSPQALAMEVEKLALSVGEAPTISLDDVNRLVGRTREEALYELTEAFGRQDLLACLTVLGRLRENGVHALIVVAGLRNFLRKLLLVRAIIDDPELAYPKGLSFAAFQKGFLPQLSRIFAPLPSALSGHPFVVYRNFQVAEGLGLAWLKQGLIDLLEAEYRLKGSALPDTLVLENFLFQSLQAGMANKK